MTILKLNFLPSAGYHIKGYGNIEQIQRLSGQTCATLAKIGDETVLIDSLSLSSLYRSSNQKTVYFARIATEPLAGQKYELYRYNTYGLVRLWKEEHVVTAPLIGVKKIWHNLYYAESDTSAYFLYVD